MTVKSIRVLIYKPGLEVIEKEIVNSLEAFQCVVDGYIERYRLGFGKNLYLICNEMGRYEKTPNRVVQNLDLIHGTFFIHKCDGAGGAISLTKDDIRLCRKHII